MLVVELLQFYVPARKRNHIDYAGHLLNFFNYFYRHFIFHVVVVFLLTQDSYLSTSF